MAIVIDFRTGRPKTSVGHDDRSGFVTDAARSESGQPSPLAQSAARGATTVGHTVETPAPYKPAKRKGASLPTEKRRAELAKIHVAKKQLGMDDETYRDMLMSQFGVESARDLSEHQRKSCILHMQRLGFEPKRGKASPQRTGAPRKRRDVPLTLEKDDSGLGRDVYMRKIEAMLAEKGRVEGTVVPWGYAVAILKKQSGGVIRCFEHATVEQLRGVISALTYDAKRKGRYAGSWGS